MIIKRGNGKILTTVEGTESLSEQTEELLKEEENKKKLTKDTQVGNKKS